MSFKLRETLRTLPAALYAVDRCPTGKTAYDTKVAARAALYRINPAASKPMRAFRCSFCARFHLGHPRGRSF